MLILALVLELVSLACLAHLWRQPDRLRQKLLWTVPILIPLLGPLLYGGVHQRALPDPTSRPSTDIDSTWWQSGDHHHSDGDADA